MSIQAIFPEIDEASFVTPFKTQLLKWIGNKQRFAHEIVSHFPDSWRNYHEPFLGSGAVLGTLKPKKAFASDIFSPLIEIWQTLHDTPDLLKHWYRERWDMMYSADKVETYEAVKASYNASPNPADLLYLCRSCYGGVVRFRKQDGYMSTPCGVHHPISPESFSQRVDIWHERVKHVTFRNLDFRDAFKDVKKGDLIYCDPPYSDTQSILYGAQSFSLECLMESIDRCKSLGAYIALSIDGKKNSGGKNCAIAIPDGLFQREIYVNCGPSMLKRFQMEGQTLELHHVADRLLLTY